MTFYALGSATFAASTEMPTPTSTPSEPSPPPPPSPTPEAPPPVCKLHLGETWAEGYLHHVFLWITISDGAGNMLWDPKTFNPAVEWREWYTVNSTDTGLDTEVHIMPDPNDSDLKGTGSEEVLRKSNIRIITENDDWDTDDRDETNLPYCKSD